MSSEKSNEECRPVEDVFDSLLKLCLLDEAPLPLEIYPFFIDMLNSGNL
jgi:hypothetical protein